MGPASIAALLACPAATVRPGTGRIATTVDAMVGIDRLAVSLPEELFLPALFLFALFALFFARLLSARSRGWPGIAIAACLGMLAVIWGTTIVLVQFDVADAAGIVDCNRCSGYQIAVSAGFWWGGLAVVVLTVLAIAWLGLSRRRGGSGARGRAPARHSP